MPDTHDPHRIVHGRQLLDRIASTVGIDPGRVSSMTITADPNDVVRLTIETIGTNDVAGVVEQLEYLAVDKEG